MTTEKIEELIGDNGEVYPIIVKAHVTAEEYRRVYASVRGHEALLLNT